jgi:capsular polysaccharide transport system ATP-binding protein
MITIRNLTKSYALGDRRHYVFKDISFDFPEGKNIGILGPNGAGKSTLLRILGGIDHPDSGEIHRNGSLSWPLGLRGGFVGHMTGRENCRMICNAYGISQKLMREKLDFIKGLSKIEEYFEQPVAYYSSGMGSRLGFALSMAFDFDYFLIDEITAVGDAHFKKLAKEALEQKRKTSKVILVSHSMGDLKRFCDVAVLIKNGEVKVYDDFDAAIEAYLPKTEQTETADAIFRHKGSLGLPLVLDGLEQASENSGLHGLINMHFLALKKALSQKTDLSEQAESSLIKASNLLANMRQPILALELVEKAIEVDAYKVNFWTQKANLLRGLKRLTAAREAIQAGLLLDSKNPGLLNAIAHLAFELGDLDQAETDARESLLGNPKSLPPWLLIARINVFKVNHSEALNALGQAEKINPKHPHLNDLKAQILFNEGAYTEGLVLSQNVFTTPPTTKTEEDWTKLLESLLLALENLNLLEEPV